VQAGSKAKSANNVGGDTLGVAYGLIDGEVTGELGFMDALEAAEEGSECCVSAFARIAVNFSLRVTIIIPSPLLGRVTDGEVVWPALVAAQLVAVQDASRQQELEEQSLAGFLGRRSADDDPHLAALSTDDLEHRRPVILKRSVPRFGVATPSRRVKRVGMRVAFFPPRSDRPHHTRSVCPASASSVPFRWRCLAAGGVR